jgi:hypothetical protein
MQQVTCSSRCPTDWTPKGNHKLVVKLLYIIGYSIIEAIDGRMNPRMMVVGVFLYGELLPAARHCFVTVANMLRRDAIFS